MKEIPWLNENFLNQIFEELFQVNNNFSESDFELFCHKKFEVNKKQHKILI